MNTHKQSCLGVVWAAIGLVSTVGCGASEGQGIQESQQSTSVTVSTEAERLPDRPNKPKYDAAPNGPSAALYPVPPDDCGDPSCSSGGGGGGGSSITSIFSSSEGRGGWGPIRDLKFTKGNSPSQPTLPGYELINVDLNKGAGGTYIYLTFTRGNTAEGAPTNKCAPNVYDGEYVTDFLADDYNAFDAALVKGTCHIGWSPVLESGGVDGWKQPDLNDGAGGRYIFAWQLKLSGQPPIQEVGVLAGNSSTIQCPSGWTRDRQDLNEGAGGDFIYFCVHY